MSFPIELKRPLVVFDIESTGISPRKDRIIELAAVKVMPDGSEIRQCWLLNPTVHIPEETTVCSDGVEKTSRIIYYKLNPTIDLSEFRPPTF